MASAPPENAVDNEDDGFEKAFNEFATGKVPDLEKEPEAVEPEGNDPPEPASGEEPPAEVPKESVTSGDGTAEGEEPPAEAAPDPWASVSPELKALYEREKEAREQAEHRARSDASRVAALSRKLATLGQSPAQGQEPSEAQKALDAKVAQLKEDFPDVAAPIIELIQAQSDELKSVRAQVTDVRADQHAGQVERELHALGQRHPDWQEISQKPEFGEWLQGQPANVQALAESWDARETGVVLTLFKVEAGMATGGQKQEAPATVVAPTATATAADARRSRQLEGGADVRSRPAPAASGAPDEFEAAFQHYAAKRDAMSRR